ncbi:MAG: hypothetical protein A2846_04980 [Candidatus Doudnabacteria bacterium RIFCSPHIGHO2_01_FULL_49_9]|uniref:Leucine--tRNA ligase n=1 Tax=Candidatus Doudnabacteria bacterium RIFCSPHIGHO2_01_FULL_49_9 TaxID=1817827 RepID=A0A1F5P0C0_9BACT|nr:MAG: hypothetical protein A2846_04980 [Candidatus Doudnabacteria bacterium RIFCSPHIGHO2_01_FULL_49_9]
MKYDPKKIESKWQKFWQQQKLYNAKDKSKMPKKYVLIEFPYPSGEGLHMGHLRPYTAGDVYSRLWRMRGSEVMYPMGWDAFGLPAENFAIKKGVHPSKTTVANIKNAKRQVQSWGMSFDWSREVNTTDPEYYKWTQWIFLQFYKAGLAYEATGLINWCPKDKTGLANEEVIDGKCERCGTVVEKKELRQWYLRITAYAEKLLEGLKNLPEWPEQVKLQQENWIGKSEGAEIEFRIENEESGIKANFLILHGKGGNSKDNFYPWLKRKLEEAGYKVQAPDLPNPEEPDDAEQAEYVLKNCKLDENTVVLGHSFGGIVALRLLERGVKLQKVTLAATPFTDKFIDGKARPTVSAALQRGFDFEKIRKNAKGFIALYDSSDGIVPVSDGEKFARGLGVESSKVRANSPHFTNIEEPEVLQVLSPVIKIFTTRPDTIFGATYMVLAPEHPLVQNLESRIENIGEVKKYIEDTKKKTDIQRSAVDKEKTGVQLKGIKVINPATGENIPVWIADYVLMGYGTGAIMAVPAHDERDFVFAKKYNLPVKKVVIPKPVASTIRNPRDIAAGAQEHLRIESECYLGQGEMINSGDFNGMESEKAKWEITTSVNGTKKTQYKLRDWVFSRQRYWGEPIPIIHCSDCGTVPVPEKDLPVRLPNVKKYEPTGTGESPLAAIEKWVNVKCPNCKGPAKRETNTMPQWAGSSWYYLRYIDPKNKKTIADRKLLKHWLPVDIYFGGMEHTTLHLLYSRFWNLFLHDQGIVPVSEPYTKRVPHGIILAEDGEKMSKSRGNVVNPDEIVKLYGADTLRMYELFLGPHEQAVTWNSRGIVGVRRFLEKVWRIASSVIPSASGQVLRYSEGSRDSSASTPQNDKLNSVLHKTIKKVTEDIVNFRFNTAVSALMILANEIEGKEINRNEVETLLKLLAPFAPHMTEELWHGLGNKTSIHLEPWPEYDEDLIKEDVMSIAVQVNGKHRSTVKVVATATEDHVKEIALADPNVKKHLEGKEVRKVIYVPEKIINFVI